MPREKISAAFLLMHDVSNYVVKTKEPASFLRRVPVFYLSNSLTSSD
jgi:hypothetical protein